MKFRYFLPACLFLFSTSLHAQTGFNYQAVVRDANGAILASQAISLRISILQDSPTASPIYQETHAVQTNPYGQVSLKIGEGTVVAGNFGTIDWSKTSFTSVELDLTGGSNYVLMGTSELGTVPKALYAERSGNAFGLNVKSFGAIGDNTADDTQAIQAAIDSAAVFANRVVFPAGNYKTTASLIVPNGVSLVGEGMGSNPLSGPYNGSAIRFEGSEAAVIFNGHTSGMRDMAIIDRSGGSATGGISIVADGRLVESLRFFNVLIFGFTGGTSLKLEAKNSGGIAYTSFYNLRIRNTKIGIHLVEDSSSFTNSNTWYHGAVSGGGFDYCLKVDGGNNNQFYGTIFEPFNSKFAHILVTEGEIQGNNIRIEGSTQAATTPLVEFKENTQNSYLSGTYGGGLTLDRGNNRIELRSGKASKFINSNHNRFENASFFGATSVEIPGWTIQGSANFSIEASDLSPEHKVLKITTSGFTSFLPNNLAMPDLGNATYYQQLNFGMYVKVDMPNTVAVAHNAPAGVATSQYHSGDNTWQFVGMTAFVNPAAALQPRLIIAGAATVYITMPTLSFGNRIPDISPKPITSAGGTITGVLSTGFAEAPAVPTTGYLVLEKEGNVFEINGTQKIRGINHLEPDHFPKGTRITLLFNNANCKLVKNSPFLILKQKFISAKNGSIELISLGNGVWREVNRNN